MPCICVSTRMNRNKPQECVVDMPMDTDCEKSVLEQLDGNGWILEG